MLFDCKVTSSSISRILLLARSVMVRCRVQFATADMAIGDDDKDEEYLPSIDGPLTSGIRYRRPPPKVTIENQHTWMVSKCNPAVVLPYEEQLRWKYRNHREILLNLSDLMARPRLTSFLPCQYGPVLPSPRIYAYRNKDNFHIGLGVDGNSRTVGQIVGSSSRQAVFTVPTDLLVSSPKKHKEVLRVLQEFIHTVQIPKTFNGSKFFWQDGFVRSNRAGDVAMAICLNPKLLGKTEVERKVEECIEFFSKGVGYRIGLHSVHIKLSAFSCNGREPFRLTLGKEYIVENLLGRKFDISPDAFFQVNTSGAEVLYRAVRQLATMGFDNSSEKPVLIDACCGTGTIGILLADHFESVIGFDIEEAAVNNARKNALRNGIVNARYYTGPAKNCLKYLLSKGILSLENQNQKPLVVVINPSRSGLADGIMRELRSIPAIKRIVYVSCNPGGQCLNNFMLLCRHDRKSAIGCSDNGDEGHQSPASRKLLLGQPFRPTKAVSVDMFPHTYHCEMVIAFDRD